MAATGPFRELLRRTADRARSASISAAAGVRRSIRGASAFLTETLEGWDEELEANGRFFTILNEDPLSQLARQERRRLLLVSAISVTVVATGLLPSKIAALGIEFSASDRQSLLYVLAAVVCYYLVAFTLYAATDLLKWLIAMGVVLLKTQDSVTVADKRIEIRDSRAGILFDMLSWPLAFVRGTFEFILPIFVALFAVAAAVAGVVPYNARLLGLLREATQELSQFVKTHQ